MQGAQYLLDFVTSYVREFVFDPDTLDDGVRIFLNTYNVKKIPLYENQEGYWRDLELVERIWKIKPDVESPEILANQQHLPSFLIQLPVHLKTSLKANQMMFQAVENLRLYP